MLCVFARGHRVLSHCQYLNPCHGGRGDLYMRRRDLGPRGNFRRGREPSNRRVDRLNRRNRLMVFWPKKGNGGGPPLNRRTAGPPN